MNLRGWVAALALTIALSVPAYADTIIQYDTEGVGAGPLIRIVSSVQAITPAQGVTGMDVIRGSGLVPASATFAINSSGWNDLSVNDYYQFGFTTMMPYQVEAFTVGLR